MNNDRLVFAAVKSQDGLEPSEDSSDQGLQKCTANRQNSTSTSRGTQVIGTAVVSCPADQASIRIGVGNSKESINDVTSSVCRRLDYILQTLRQHGVKVGDVSVRKHLYREADLYHMEAEIIATFSDFEEMEQARAILLEKMDKSVSVGAPRFFHSAECLAQLRRRACVSAVENAKQKACQISQLLDQSLGPLLLVREEDPREWMNEDEDFESGDLGTINRPHLPRIPTMTASSRVCVLFGLRDKKSQTL